MPNWRLTDSVEQLKALDKKHKILLGGGVFLILVVILLLFAIGSESGRPLRQAAVGLVAERIDFDVRKRLILENPGLLQAVKRGGVFGGPDYSVAVAQDILGRDPKAVEDIRKIMRVEPITPQIWMIRLPLVNVILVETKDGLVLIDSGMQAAGEPLMEAVRDISSAPLRAVIYTHHHIDHAYGAWAFLEAGETPQIIAHENLPKHFQRYIDHSGLLARLMSQPQASFPKNKEDLVWPTRTFRERLDLTIGGETFHLRHHRGETDDHLYVWMPQRRILINGDFYQGFLPNAGNGKRIQRHPEEWAEALREMAKLRPLAMLPGHGEPLLSQARIQENLGVLANALSSIVEQTKALLNQGLRKDLIPEQVKLAPELAEHPTLNVQYVSVADISKMVIRRHTGWWDDVPSHWSPANLDQRAKEIASLAGGVEVLAVRARALLDQDDLRMAAHLADWAIMAEPDSEIAQELFMDTYLRRATHPESNTMEILNYIDAMAKVRGRQLVTANDSSTDTETVQLNAPESTAEQTAD